MAAMNYIRTSNFRRARTVAINQSPFSAKVNRAGFQDWRWQFEFAYRPMRRVDAAPLLALIASQGEGEGQFGVFDPDFPTPLTSYQFPGSVAGAAQEGAALVTAGWQAASMIARASDKVFVEFPGTKFQLFELLQDVVSDSAGVATLALDAPLRGSPVNGGLVSLNPTVGAKPRLTVRMTGYQKPTDAAGFFAITLNGEEIV